VRDEPNGEIELVAPGPGAETEFLSLVARSTELHDGWVHPPADPDAYERYLARIATDHHRGFFARDIPTGDLVGVVNVNDVVLGALRSASLGYYGFASKCGNGRMTAAVGLAVSYAFSELRLHRIEANIQPGNWPSRALVQRLGFRLEGLSPRYLYVSGDWRDHERWAVLSEDW
jgi:ribosomal-protein-alanine N-acetyltransferase